MIGDARPRDPAEGWLTMTTGWREQVRPGMKLRALVREATAALVAMDARRLEELARCCEDLNCEFQETSKTVSTTIEMQSMSEDVILLSRVLQETRANLVILSRLRAIRLRERLAPGPVGRPQLSSIQPSRRELFEEVVYGDN
jgi:hypothetical protein